MQSEIFYTFGRKLHMIYFVWYFWKGFRHFSHRSISIDLRWTLDDCLDQISADTLHSSRPWIIMYTGYCYIHLRIPLSYQYVSIYRGTPSWGSSRSFVLICFQFLSGTAIAWRVFKSQQFYYSRSSLISPLRCHISAQYIHENYLPHCDYEVIFRRSSHVINTLQRRRVILQMRSSTSAVSVFRSFGVQASHSRYALRRVSRSRCSKRWTFDWRYPRPLWSGGPNHCPLTSQMATGRRWRAHSECREDTGIGANERDGSGLARDEVQRWKRKRRRMAQKMFFYYLLPVC